MYNSFEIINFRCFHHFEIESFSRINLITGKNNVGKTAFLEALFLHSGAYNPALTIKLNALREIGVVKIDWDSLFREFEPEKVMELKGEFQGSKYRQIQLKSLPYMKESLPFSPSALTFPGQTLFTYSIPVGNIPETPEIISHVLELKCKENEEEDKKYYLIVTSKGLRMEPTPPPPPFTANFISTSSRMSAGEQAEYFGNFQIQGKEEDFLKVLKVIEPRLKGIKMVVQGGKPVLHGDIGLNRTIPLFLMGEGMGRLAGLVLTISQAHGGVVLLDEIENGFHHTVLKEIWKIIDETAQNSNTQIFATTHSWEAIRAAHEAFSQKESYDFQLYRLERVNSNIEAISYDQKMLEVAIETGLETR